MSEWTEQQIRDLVIDVLDENSQRIEDVPKVSTLGDTDLLPLRRSSDGTYVSIEAGVLADEVVDKIDEEKIEQALGDIPDRIEALEDQDNIINSILDL